MKKIYGPYLRKDGRKHICIIDGDIKTTMSYPKYLMEQHLGRKLLDTETVDHINRDFADDRIENLQILSPSEHSKLDAIRAKEYTDTCIWCKTEFTKRIKRYARHAKVQGKSGPFCSRKCSGQYGAEVQNGRTSIIGDHRKNIEPEYYRLEK